MERRHWNVAAVIAACLGIVLIYRWWNRPPAVEFDNLRYIQLLSTAVSARNMDWLAKVDDAIQERHAEGQMSDHELGHFEQLILLAQSGEWDVADRRCFEFAEAQLARRRSRPASDDHEHDH